jgi:hypothetical protein
MSVVLMAGILGLVGCSTLTVNTDYDRTVDFSRYKTFNIRPSKSIQQPFLRERLERAVTAQLEAKGLTRVSGGADLWVALHGRVTQRTVIDSTSFGYGYRWGWWGGMGVTTRTVRKVPVGTLVVDLVDAGARQLVWQASASDTLEEGGTPADREARVNEAVAKMFADFPPRTR